MPSLFLLVMKNKLESMGKHIVVQGHRRHRKFLTCRAIGFASFFFWWIIVQYTCLNRLAKFQSCRPAQKKSGCEQKPIVSKTFDTQFFSFIWNSPRCCTNVKKVITKKKHVEHKLESLSQLECFVSPPMMILSSWLVRLTQKYFDLTGHRQLGLRYEDLWVQTPAVQEALRRLPLEGMWIISLIETKTSPLQKKKEILCCCGETLLHTIPIIGNTKTKKKTEPQFSIFNFLPRFTSLFEFVFWESPVLSDNFHFISIEQIARDRRIKVAFDLSNKGSILPKDKWLSAKDDKVYLAPFQKEVEKELAEKQAYRYQ